MRAQYKACTPLPKWKRQPTGCLFHQSRLLKRQRSRHFSYVKSTRPRCLFILQITRLLHCKIERLEFGVLVGKEMTQLANKCFPHIRDSLRAHGNDSLFYFASI